MDLLQTKLTAPPFRPNLVLRPRLAGILDAGLGGQLTLVSAPAGFGKTTLVSEWLHKKAEGRRQKVEPSSAFPLPSAFAWLSLDQDDNDPARFLAYLTTAIERLQKGAGETAHSLLQSPQPPPPMAIVSSLINALADEAAVAYAPDNRYVLVLDDYHTIRAGPLHEAMACLLEHQPACLHLMILTRADPPLPGIPRLRSRNQLAEMRAADLRFTVDEAAVFLNQVMGLDVSATDVAALEARTEGWIAGLQMAALSMQGRPDIPAFVRAFTGSHRYVVDYLIEEVFRGQPEELRDFLLQTCILDRLHGPLCDQVTGRSDSQANLERLEAANLFLIPLDDERRWYRYHQLFRDVLQSRLRQAYPEQLPGLHCRAAAWYEQEGQVETAIHHALAARDFHSAERILQDIGNWMLTAGRWSTLLAWLEAMPDSFTRTRPALCLYSAWALFLTGRWEAVESYLQDVEQLLSAGKEHLIAEGTPAGEPTALIGWRGQVATIRGQMASFQGDTTRAIEHSQQALAWLPADNLLMRGVVAVNLGFTYLNLGNWSEAERLFSEGRAACEAAGNESMALAAANGLASIDEAHGRLHQAAAGFSDVLLRAGSRLDQAAIGAHYDLAGVLYEWNDLDRAWHHISQARNLSNQLQLPRLRTYCDLRMARIRQAQGDRRAASELLASALSLQTSALGLQPSAISVAVVSARLAAGRGDREILEQYLQRKAEILSRPYTVGRGPEHHALVQAHLALGQLPEAEVVLESLAPAARAGGHVGLQIEILALQALLLWKRGDTSARLSADQARAEFVLNQALTMAEPGGYTRTFLDLGPALQELMLAYRLRGKGRACPEPVEGEAEDSSHHLLAYVDRLLLAFDPAGPAQPGKGDIEAPASQILIEALSERELEVLRLMADGQPNQAIANTLFLALGTVKSHAHHIYAKLDVQSRTQAIARARELGLI
jgi:LuxR family transcriptional regulator, maltose regulon positive regulatory protein